MQYELVSRAVAYVSCFSTLSLFMTSMAFAAINVGKVRSTPCLPYACLAGVWVGKDAAYGALTSKAHVEVAAAKLWSAKS